MQKATAYPCGFFVAHHKYSMTITEEIIEQPSAEPISVDALLKHHCRLAPNITIEDELLEEYITTARQTFEHLTNRTLIETTFRQYSDCIGPMVLWRGKTTSIEGIYYYDADDELVELEEWQEDLTGLTGKVWLDTYPAVSSSKSPVYYVEYKAGWEDPSEVPSDIKIALRQHVATLYLNRESHSAQALKPLPISYEAIVNKYWVGL